ncbi:hypothetical protein NBRC10513v2_007250 [Rhodotorula toruloides]
MPLSPCWSTWASTRYDLKQGISLPLSLSLDLAIANPLLPPNLVVKTIHPDPVPPWSPNPAPRVDLARGKELGTYEHEQVVRDLTPGSLLVYTDGSMGDSGLVGAGVAARVWNGGKVVLAEKEEVDIELWQRERKGMGQRQTVYTGELEGLRMALSSLLITQTADTPLAALISLNNTSAHTHSTDPTPSSGQHLRKLPSAGLLLGNPSYRDALLDFLDRTGRFPRLSKLPEVEKKNKE